MTHYTDVEAGAWYEESASALLESGALDESETRLRPNDLATRAEVLKMLVLVYGEDLRNPATPSFSDVPRSAWYYTYVETAANAGWLRGDRDCYQLGTRPCTARPADRVNRAEMAALLQRAFSLTHDRTAPVFPDVDPSQWYYGPIQAAADHCILQGDDATGRVRPAAFMNRAEMIVMFHRASQSMRYGEHCGDDAADAPEVIDVSALSATRVRVTFNTDLNRSWADDTARYDVQNVGSVDHALSVSSVSLIDDDAVELTLNTSMTANTQYRLSVQNMRTADGRLFGDTSTFVFASVSPDILDATHVAPDRIRLRFNSDLRASVADDANRYTVERTGGGTVGVDSVTVIDARTVELDLASSLTAGSSYSVTGTNLMTSSDIEFTDRVSFGVAGPAPTMSGAVALSASRVRLDFSTSLDEGFAEDPSRYSVTTQGRDIDVWFATRVDENSVELVLSELLQNQRRYTVTASNLRTSGGATFTQSGSFVYGAATITFDTTLTGAQETPSVATSASGTGSFVLTANGLQYDIFLRNLSGSQITGAHFHSGASGVAGPVLEPITFTGNRATGTWTDLTESERDLLLSGNVYVNFHTAANPNGEIRGQLIRRP